MRPCKHCRASAQQEAAPGELTTDQAKALIDQAATFPRRPMMVMTGGDPLKRHDLFDLIRHAVAAGFHVALTPSATPLATYEAFAQAKDAGIRALGISLDGADAVTYDAFRGWEGSFERTLRMLDDARRLALPVQVNTSITPAYFQQIDRMAELLTAQGIAMWSVFSSFPSAGAWKSSGLPRKSTRSSLKGFGITLSVSPTASRRPRPRTTAATCSNRAAIRWPARPVPRRLRPQTARRAAWRGRRQGRDVRQSHRQNFPAGFLPLCCGQFPADSSSTSTSRHPTFLALAIPTISKASAAFANTATSVAAAARAYALTGDLLAPNLTASTSPPLTHHFR